MQRINAGYAHDRLTQPFITIEIKGTIYVQFPFCVDTEYQKKRYYMDERLMSLDEFKKLKNGVNK